MEVNGDWRTLFTEEKGGWGTLHIEEKKTGEFCILKIRGDGGIKHIEEIHKYCSMPSITYLLHGAESFLRS